MKARTPEEIATIDAQRRKNDVEAVNAGAEITGLKATEEQIEVARGMMETDLADRERTDLKIRLLSLLPQLQSINIEPTLHDMERQGEVAEALKAIEADLQRYDLYLPPNFTVAQSKELHRRLMPLMTNLVERAKVVFDIAHAHAHSGHPNAQIMASVRTAESRDLLGVTDALVERVAHAIDGKSAREAVFYVIYDEIEIGEKINKLDILIQNGRKVMDFHVSKLMTVLSEEERKSLGLSTAVKNIREKIKALDKNSKKSKFNLGLSQETSQLEKFIDEYRRKFSEVTGDVAKKLLSSPIFGQ